ncbi:MAG: 30S ribosomal protein S16 [Anaerolineaceae bacterium]
MVRIRLRRVGLRNQPSYRIVVADKESPRDGRFLEIVGFYNPRTEPATIEFQEDRIYEWLSKGAQPSEPVSRLFKVVSLMDRFNRYKAGESVDKILADAKIFYDARVVDPRTRRDAKPETPAKKKAKVEKEEKAEPEATKKEEAEAKPVEAEKVEKPVAEAEKIEAPEVKEDKVEPIKEEKAEPVKEEKAEPIKGEKAEPAKEEKAKPIKAEKTEPVKKAKAKTSIAKE